MNPVVSLAFCLMVSGGFVLLFRRINISAVVAMIIAGIVAGSGFFRAMFLEPNLDLIIGIGDIGLFSMMFIAGMEISWSMLYKEKKDAAVVSLFASFVPLLLGFTVFMLLGFGPVVSLFVGICMSITAEATKAKVLVELNKLKTKIGSLMMGVGIIDDIFGMFLFIVLGYLLSASFATKEVMLLAGAVMSFFLGVSIHQMMGRTHQKIRKLEKTLFYLISPFFFVSLGISFSAQSIIFEPVLSVVIIIVAFAGKMLGTMFTRPFTKLSPRQIYLLGLGMNSRGAVELPLAFIALRAGMFPVSIYSGLIVMAIFTTLMFPLFFSRIVRGNPKIMD